MEVVKHPVVTMSTEVRLDDECGVDISMDHRNGMATFYIDQMDPHWFTARIGPVDMPHDRAQHYHELLVSKVQAFIGEIEAVMKEVGL